MKAKQHYNKISFQTLMYHVSGLQKIRIQRQRMSEWLDVIFEGEYRDLDKKENRKIAFDLAYEQFGTVKADGDTLIIGINI